MTALLDTKLGCTSYKVTPDAAIHLYEYLDQPAVISELAVKNGVGLVQIMMKEMNLENYFIQLVGGMSND
jgi:ABC-2 type transport system ATP-binding protein